MNSSISTSSVHLVIHEHVLVVADPGFGEADDQMALQVIGKHQLRADGALEACEVGEDRWLASIALTISIYALVECLNCQKAVSGVLAEVTLDYWKHK